MAIELPSPIESVFGLGFFYILYCIYWEVTVGAGRRKIIREKGCQPIKSLPDWDPIWGFGTFRETMKALKEHRLLELGYKRWKAIGANSFKINTLGTPLIITLEPENIKTVLALDFKNFTLGKPRKTAFLPFLGSGIFTTDGTAWQHSRDMLRPNFVRSQVGDLDTFDEHTENMIKNIPHDGSTVDLQDLFFRLTMDSATQFLFGESTGSLVPGAAVTRGKAFADAFNSGQERIGTRARLGRLATLFGNNKSFKEDCKVVHDFVDYFVDAGFANRETIKSQTGGRYVFLNELLKQTDDKVQIRSELLNILLAGRDTTASLLSNVWFELSRRPEVYKKLREEVNALGGKKPSFQQIKDMKYLRALLNESLRLHPVVPGNSRQATNDTVLPTGGGPDGKSPIFVPAGMIVGWSLWSMHRRTDFYGPDAEEFRPDRWLGDKGLRPSWEYLPFNGGPRICIGQQFALTEASYTTIRLMQTFKDIESRDPRPWQEWLTLTCTGFNGCKVSMTPA